MSVTAIEPPRAGTFTERQHAGDAHQAGVTTFPGEPAADRAAVILTPDQRVRVFISSTLQELAQERAAARRAIRRLHLAPVWYESGARPHPPRSMYRAYLEQSQVFVGIYWQRYGWVAPGMDISGLEDEYRLAAGKPMLLYLKRPAPDTEPRMTEFLDGIRAAGVASYRTFTTPRELERLLADDLAVLLSESFAGATITAGAPGESVGAGLPTGTVTFLVTEIEGSTRLWEVVPDAMARSLALHNEMLRAAFEHHGGVVYSTTGAGMAVAFSSAVEATRAALEAQRALLAALWPDQARALKVRMGLHTDEAVQRDGRYVSSSLDRGARLMAAAHGGQILLSGATEALVRTGLPDGATVVDLGEHRLRDFADRSHIFQLAYPDLPSAFPPLRLADAVAGNLPLQLSSFIGREREVEQIAAILGEARLLTLTGPGGIGKTRLAVAVGERLQDRFGANMAFVPLATVTDPELVLGGVARAAGADLGGAGSPLQALAEWFGGGWWLLILDNLEQVVDAAGDLGELLARCPGVTILATSRTALGLAAEREYPVPPLPLPLLADLTTWSSAELEFSPAVALFVDRARAVHPGFTLAEDNAAAVAEICRRLEGLPLAIELAAARTRLLDPAELLDRLTASLEVLGTTAVDLPERQRTLRATVEWSVGLLDEAERSLLETVAVFVDGWTIAAAAHVAGLEEQQALELSESLARHSLVQLDAGSGASRCRMLETVRAFVADRLAARPDAAEIQSRHADYYRALTEQADRPLRGAGHAAWTDRLQAEAGNLAAAVRWYLIHDPATLPHLFRILYPFWYLRDRQAEARPWVDQLLPGSFDPQTRAELEWTATVIANEIGDDAAALAACRRLRPLLENIKDPFLHAIGQLATAWTLPITDDFDNALREVSISLEQLRDQDEPFWTALAAYTAAVMETTLGRPDRALQHLSETSALADRLGSAWLTVMSRVQLGTLAVMQGRLDQGRELLNEALDVSLAIRITRHVTLCLAALAQLAFAEGDPERAALLAGAAEGLRRRAGLRTWPILRRGETELAAKVRRALGDGRFGQEFATGCGFSQQEAVAAARHRPGTAGVQDDPAAQNVHAIVAASRRSAREVTENAHLLTSDARPAR